MRSSVQPLFGLEYAPQSTLLYGLGVRDNDAYWLVRSLSYADFHGSAAGGRGARTATGVAND